MEIKIIVNSEELSRILSEYEPECEGECSCGCDCSEDPSCTEEALIKSELQEQKDVAVAKVIDAMTDKIAEWAEMIATDKSQSEQSDEILEDIIKISEVLKKVYNIDIEEIVERAKEEM